MNIRNSVFGLMVLVLAACAAPPTAVPSTATAPELTLPEPKTCIEGMNQNVQLKDINVWCPIYVSAFAPDDSFAFFKEAERINIDELRVSKNEATFRMGTFTTTVQIGGVLRFGDIPLAYLAAISESEVLMVVPEQTSYKTVVGYNNPDRTNFPTARGLFGVRGSLLRVYHDQCFSAKLGNQWAHNILGHIEGGDAIFNLTPAHLPARVGQDVKVWANGSDSLAVAMLLGTIQNRANLKEDSVLMFWYDDTYIDCTQ